MKFDKKMLRVVMVVFSMFVLTHPALSQNVTYNHSPILLEVVRISCARDCERETTRVFADGRFLYEGMLLEKSKSGKFRRVSTRTEKQLEADEVAELSSWGRQADFLKAQQEYVKIVRDQPDNITIIYRHNGLEKKVQLGNYFAMSAEEKARIPLPVMKMLRWVYPYGFQ